MGMKRGLVSAGEVLSHQMALSYEVLWGEYNKCAAELTVYPLGPLPKLNRIL